MNQPRLSSSCSSRERRFWWVGVVFSPVVWVFRAIRVLARTAIAIVPTLSSLWYYYAPAPCRHAIALLRTPRDIYFSFWKRVLRP